MSSFLLCAIQFVWAACPFGTTSLGGSTLACCTRQAFIILTPSITGRKTGRIIVQRCRNRTYATVFCCCLSVGFLVVHHSTPGTHCHLTALSSRCHDRWLRLFRIPKAPALDSVASKHVPTPRDKAAAFIQVRQALRTAPNTQVAMLILIVLCVS